MTDPVVFSPWLIGLLVLDLVLAVFGAGWLWRRRRGLAARVLGLAGSPLAAAPWRPSELFLAGACVMCGALVGQQVALVALAPWFASEPSDGPGFIQVAAGAGLQFGLLGGLALARLLLRTGQTPGADTGTESPERRSTVEKAGATCALRGGFITFAVALAVVFPVSIFWQGALRALGVDAPPQDLISLFRDAGDMPSLTLLLGLAILVAPVAEELLFRAGIFRWLRTRAPRGVALILPAFLFALIHGNLAVLLPLLALALVLALAYENYGHVGVPMLAHALFNLNTIALVLAGFPS